MKKTLKRISFVLAMLMIFGVFVSCAEPNNGGSGNGGYNGIGEWDGTRETTPDNLPEWLDFNGDTISVIHREGLQEYEASGDGEVADIVYQAVYERNLKVESRLNIKFDWVPTKSGGLSETKTEMVNLLSAFVDDYDYILTTNNTILASVIPSKS